ncbi:MAG: ImuA family protein, partial [Phycisphaerales bacterium]
MDFVRASNPFLGPVSLESLRERLRDAEGPGGREGREGRAGECLPTGLGPLDGVLPGGGLRAGAVHELLSSGEEAPLALFGLFAAGATRGVSVWIGSAVFPSVWALRAAGPDLAAHLLIDARREGDRLWAADLALRCSAVSRVIADGSSFDAAATRRLQLAAESTSALCLLARPERDRAGLSTAATRWLIEPAVSPHHSCARWTVRLLRCK